MTPHAAQLREALEFYAAPEAWHGPNTTRDIPEGNFGHPDCPYRWDATRDGGDIARQALSLPSPSEWRHKARGTLYTKVCTAELQTADAASLNDGDLMEVYQGADGRFWVRFTEEFYDGRFEPLPAPPETPRDER